MESGGGVGEQIPDDDQDGAGDRDQGFEFAAAFDDAPVAFAEEGVGLGGCGSGFAERTFQVGVAFAGLAAAADGTGLDGAWAQFRPGNQVLGCGEAAHIQPDLGDDRSARRVRPMPGISSSRSMTLGAQWATVAGSTRVDAAAGGVGSPPPVSGSASMPAPGPMLGVAVIDGPSRVGQLGDQLLDARGQGVDLGGKRIDLAQQHPRQLGVMIIEAAIERG